MLQKLPEDHQIVIEHRLIVNDQRGCREYDLNHSTYSIGKAAQADIRLYTQSPLIALHHATLMLFRQDGTSSYQIVAEKLEGVLNQYKILVNGNPLQTHLLQDKDTITFAPDVYATYHYTSRIEPIPEFSGCIFLNPNIIS
jgi:pSer/pThr/pTyr-binding forkhead associated (FHA) protein